VSCHIGKLRFKRRGCFGRQASIAWLGRETALRLVWRASISVSCNPGVSRAVIIVILRVAEGLHSIFDGA
jgi:hypothetical protein